MFRGATDRRLKLNTKTLFFVGFIVCASGVISPPVALTLGLIFGLSFEHPYQADSRNLSRFLLQASVVGLGFGMNLHEVLRAGRSGFVYTAAGISFALIFGLLAGRLLRVNKTASILISTGTAICGGSAIAAVAPIIGARNCNVARYNLYFEFDRATDFPAAGLGAASHTNTIWLVGGIGHS